MDRMAIVWSALLMNKFTFSSGSSSSSSSVANRVLTD